MGKKIEFPEEIEKLRLKYKVNKTNMQKFLASCGSLDSVAEYLPLIKSEYEVDHQLDTPPEPTPEPESHTKTFRGKHPITGEEVWL